ncbi:chavicol O-methyltransferase-like [Salvia miltiorrhiza]|uniref:chavicol O-methyltransferase-like n=1 Tax=Salvia miltiorrhiza TaxID=226208 RepID=UPI0025AD8CF6|nr:chavicol O-methyltransferase-like [Salvia miltiorrhiza]
MAFQSGEVSTDELIEAQAYVWNHTFAFVNSVSLKCAIQLGIPDAIHKHGHPITLSQLVESLHADHTKSQCIHRLMRLLVQSKFFTQDTTQEEARYWLTPASRLLLRKASLTVAPLVLLILDPILTEPWFHMSEWLTNERHLTPFEAAHGSMFWERMAHESGLGSLFEEAMRTDSRLVAHVLVRDYKHVFEGIKTLADVGGGTGTMAKAIVDALPGIKCLVLDLPHVVAGLESTHKLRYVGGDMFEAIPAADAVLLKWIMHDWDDDKCLKILKRCKEAVGTGGKVMIIDVVVDVKREDDKVVEDQLYFDMAMMTYFNGKERSEKEWAKLFSDAGFTSYKITHAFGVRSLLEAYP